MQVEGLFEWLGQVLGSFIRFIVEGLRGFFSLLADAGSSFINGLSKALGMSPSLLGIIVLIIGLLLLFAAFRAFMRKSIVFGLIWLLLALWVLSLVVS